MVVLLVPTNHSLVSPSTKKTCWQRIKASDMQKPSLLINSLLARTMNLLCQGLHEFKGNSLKDSAIEEIVFIRIVYNLMNSSRFSQPLSANWQLQKIPSCHDTTQSDKKALMQERIATMRMERKGGGRILKGICVKCSMTCKFVLKLSTELSTKLSNYFPPCLFLPSQSSCTISEGMPQ